MRGSASTSPGHAHGRSTPPPGTRGPAAAMSPRMRAFILVVNLLGGIVAGLPLLAPWLLARGQTRPAGAIYLAYRAICHQMPSRSFVVFGHQLAYCQRNTAIYTGVFLFGLSYALARGRIGPLRWRWMGLLWLPMALDGFSQLSGLRESTWQLRALTGGLFALSCVWVGFPLLEQGFAAIREQLEDRFARMAAGAATTASPAS